MIEKIFMKTSTKIRDILNTKRYILQKIEIIILFLSYTIYIMNFMYGYVYVMGDIFSCVNKITKCLLAFIVIKDIIELRKANTKKAILTIGVLLIFVISALVSDNKNVLYIVMFIIAFKNIKFDKFIKYDLILKSVSIILIVVCYYLNFTDVYIMESTTRGARYSMGFSHPNIFAIYVVSVFFEYIYLKRNENHIKDVIKYIIIGAIIFFIIDYFTDSRTSLIMIALLLLFIVIDKIFSYEKIKNKLIDIFGKKDIIKKVLKIVVSNLFIILSLFSILMGYLYTNDYEIAYKANKMTSGRISYISSFLNKYDINLLGNKLELVSTRETEETGEKTAILDNGYVRILLEYGLIVFGLIWFYFQKILSHYINKKEKMIVTILIIFLISGLMETHFYLLQYNVFLLGFSEILYGSAKNKWSLKQKENKETEAE